MRDSEMREVSDTALAIAIARYDDAALAEMYRRHGGAVLGLARRILGDRTEGEDVVQEVFLGLWHRPHAFDPTRGSMRSLLLTMAHRRAVDVLRSTHARRAREERDAGHRAVFNDLDREIWDLTVGEQVRSALATLGEGEREAIELAYFGAHTYREVAALLDQPEGTIKSRISRGLRRLHEALIDIGAEP